jgi:hypothetical protein
MKVLEGIRGLSWQDGEYNTFIAVLGRALRHRGDPHSYSYLMGLSGAAFRLQIHRDGLCPSGPDATCGFDSAAHLLQTLRYGHHRLLVSDGEEKIKSAVKQTIDAGFPVIAVDLIQVPDWGIIVGYDDAEHYLVLSYYNDQAEKPQPAEKTPWIVYILGEKLGPVNRDESERTSLLLLKNLLENRSYGAYHTGQAGFEIWQDRLKNIGRFLAGSRGKRQDHLIGNYWNYVSLIDSRRAARKYLREEIRHRRFENDLLYREMGDLFGREAEALDQYHIQPPFQDEGQGMLEEGNLGRQIQALEKAAKLEKQVLELWDRLEL